MYNSLSRHFLILRVPFSKRPSNCSSWKSITERCLASKLHWFLIQGRAKWTKIRDWRPMYVIHKSSLRGICIYILWWLSSIFMHSDLTRPCSVIWTVQALISCFVFLSFKKDLCRGAQSINYSVHILIHCHQVLWLCYF